MRWLHPLPRSLLLSCFAITLLAGAPLANGSLPQPATQYQPKPGQQGKDVIWLPTSNTLVETMLNLANLTPDDFVIDLGAGDGRTVIAAAKRGARALGIEYEARLVELSRRNAEKEGVSGKAEFVRADLFETDLSQATVITMFLLPTINMQLRPKMLELKPGTRVVSNSFGMGDWAADDRVMVTEGCQAYCTALFWIVPAKVAGTWQTPQGELVLEQKYQIISGTLRNGELSAPIMDGKLRGNEIAFTAAGGQYRGRVTGETIEGLMSIGTNEAPWRATRRSL